MVWLSLASSGYNSFESRHSQFTSQLDTNWWHNRCRKGVYELYALSSYVPQIYYGKEEPPLLLGLASREQPSLLLSRRIFVSFTSQPDTNWWLQRHRKRVHKCYTLLSYVLQMYYGQEEPLWEWVSYLFRLQSRLDYNSSKYLGDLQSRLDYPYNTSRFCVCMSVHCP